MLKELSIHVLISPFQIINLLIFSTFINFASNISVGAV